MVTLQVNPSYSSPSPQQYFSGSSQEPSYAPVPTTPPPADFQEEVEEDKYGLPLAPVYHSRIGETDNKGKRESQGLLMGEPGVYTQSVGVPDIWDMFSNEWGNRLSRRNGK